MLNRRSRIKGIANILQRRKPITTGNVSTFAETVTNTHVPTTEIAASGKSEIKELINSEVAVFVKPAVKGVDSHKPVSNIDSKSILVENAHGTIKRDVLKIIESAQVKSINVAVEVGNETPFIKPSFDSKGHRQKSDSASEGGDGGVLFTGSDTESTKAVNRSRIKAVPRFRNRRSSPSLQHGSASESEDDVKRINQKVQTDLASVLPSNKEKPKEFSSIVQKKCKRSDQSRKMAEARREFNNKFGKNIPDKQKLTMMDLIFYNPTNNPMIQKCKKAKKKPEEVEKEDDPIEDLDEREEEETKLPTPRIKIGADGEIVVDEQSLIIENVALKRGREELEKSEVIDGDLETGYGVYKRVKRSKDWTNEETMLFYRALNTLGTDFTLMTQLFPKRTRKELKMKFKKEERINASLIDKALTQPVHFNIIELKEEIKNREQAAKLKSKRNENVVSQPNDNVPYINNKKSSRYRCGNKSKRKDEEKKESREKPIGIKKFLVFSDDESIAEEESNSNNTLDDISNATNEFPQSAPNLQPLEPGSLMIVASTTPSGEPQMKVFMVTSNNINSSDTGVSNNPVPE